MANQEQKSICREIGARTGGDIYIGVVGPVRSGKSTFIKRFMEQLVLPAMSGSAAARERARDELPQSAAGRTIMTTEPKFIPEAAVPLALEGGGECSIRLIDCVGYMVEGAMGHEENDKPRMVKSPWFDEEIPFDLAAETGTRKVIRDHSTIGIVITTDGSISDIPREDYLEPEERVIRELQELGKPFIVLLNSEDPKSDRTLALAGDIASRYQVKCVPVNCLRLEEEDVGEILKAVLYDGSYHPVDSNEMAFKMAAILAFKEAMPNAGATLLEPIGTLKVTIPDNYVGDVMGDLNKRRGRVMGMNPTGDGEQVLEAEVPMAEMSSYTIDLRSMTQGRGSFTCKFVRYEEAPGNVQQKVIEEAKKEQEA